MRYRLKPHPDSICAAVTDIEVDAVRPRAGSLLLSYVVAGNVGDLLLSAGTGPARADELWRHTCFEAFIRGAPNGGYYELNFAPSSQWAAYQFSDYRTGMQAATKIEPPKIGMVSTGGCYTLRAALELSDLSSALRWWLGLSAVIEEANGRKSYWALAHPPGKPDFHHLDCFKAELSPA
jgi:hypothetical protein